jgi:hypothetical protein
MTPYAFSRVVITAKGILFAVKLPERQPCASRF